MTLLLRTLAALAMISLAWCCSRLAVGVLRCPWLCNRLLFAALRIAVFARRLAPRPARRGGT